MSQFDLKEARFEKYCKHCKYFKVEETEDPCDDCLSSPMNVESHKPVRYDGPDIPEDQIPSYFLKKQKLANYLYFMEYDSRELNYGAAERYYKNEEGGFAPFGCSAVRKGPWFGRNLDWIYNDNAEFVVRVIGNGRYPSSIGIAGGFPELTNSFVHKNDRSPYYSIVPFQMYDGMNEHGLTACMNVVPTDYGFNTSIPLRQKKVSISSLMLIRFILDYFDDALTACEYIMDYVEVRFPKSMHDMGYEVHYMIADLHSTYILEFVGKRAQIIDATLEPYMTNFHLFTVRKNPDGLVYTPATQIGNLNAIDYNNITKNGSGLERYNLIAEAYPYIYSMEAMRDILDQLKYTRAYPSGPDYAFWFTEFVGNRGLTCASKPYEFTDVIDIADYYYKHRDRFDGGKTWHTVHSSLYDMYEKVLYLRTQEKDFEYTFY